MIKPNDRSQKCHDSQRYLSEDAKKRPFELIKILSQHLSLSEGKATAEMILKPQGGNLAT